MIILAPMQGLTELLFRRAYEMVFPGMIDCSISPFLSLTHGNLKDAWKKIDDVVPEKNVGSIPVIPQILGNEPLEFVDLANRLYDIGYEEINWNIGCPMRRVAGKHRGAGILPYPNEVRTVLENVIPQMKGSFSVKMRLGYYNEREIFDLIPILNDYPIKNVTIHPRIGKQVYSGVPNMLLFSQVLPLIHHPVIYNGDVCTSDRYLYIKATYPEIKDIMIGRGILFDPLLPSKIKGIETPITKSQEFILVLVEAILQRQMPIQSKIRKIKEYWCLQYKSLGVTELQKYELLHTSDLKDTIAAILKYAPIDLFPQYEFVEIRKWI